jgi:hypothetical protein
MPSKAYQREQLGISEDILGGPDADSDDEERSGESEESGIEDLTVDDFDLDPQ